MNKYKSLVKKAVAYFPFGLGNKILRLCKIAAKIILLPVSLPLSLMIRFLGFRVLPVSSTRIGHLICETDCLIKEIAMQRIKPKKWLIFYDGANVCNSAYLELLPDYFFPVNTKNFILKMLQKLLLARVVNTQTNHYVTAMYQSAQIYPIQVAWEGGDPTIHCPKDWLEAKNQVLKRHGISSGQPYVCIHARESGYSPTDEIWHCKRNVNIMSYSLAVEYLIACGYAVIRMGDHTMAPLDQEFSGVFDYARSSDKSPWLDLAISAECSFFLGSASGAYTMANVFLRPVVCVGMSLPFNFSPSGYSFDIGIPKLFRDRSSDTLISIKDIFETGLAELRLAEEVNGKGYELVENTAEEILDTVKEMVGRLMGNWVETAEDKQLQSIIRSYIGVGSYSYGSNARCGAAFLRKYKLLL
jgi:putative glycosyltransferase (TIGR04372 family)